MGGVDGRSTGSSNWFTSSSLSIEGTGEGARKRGGLAAVLGAAAAGKKGIGIGESGGRAVS